MILFVLVLLSFSILINVCCILGSIQSPPTPLPTWNCCCLRVGFLTKILLLTKILVAVEIHLTTPLSTRLKTHFSHPIHPYYRSYFTHPTHGMKKYRMRLLSIVFKDTNISFPPSWNEKLLTRNIGKTRCSILMTNKCWRKRNKNNSLLLQKAGSWNPSYFVWNPSIFLKKQLFPSKSLEEHKLIFYLTELITPCNKISPSVPR